MFAMKTLRFLVPHAAATSHLPEPLSPARCWRGLRNFPYTPLLHGVISADTPGFPSVFCFSCYRTSFRSFLLAYGLSANNIPEKTMNYYHILVLRRGRSHNRMHNGFYKTNLTTYENSSMCPATGGQDAGAWTAIPLRDSVHKVTDCATAAFGSRWGDSTQATPVFRRKRLPASRCGHVSGYPNAYHSISTPAKLWAVCLHQSHRLLHRANTTRLSHYLSGHWP